MSGIGYATAILLGRSFAIAATTGALFSVASEIGPRAFSPAEPPPLAQQTSKRTDPPPTSIEPTSTAVHSAYERAMVLANQAVVAYQSSNQAADLKTQISFTQREQFLWQTALQELSKVPASSASYSQASEKRSHYQTLLATAEGKLAEQGNAVLKGIVNEAGVAPEQVHITLCQINSGQINGGQINGGQINSGQINSGQIDSDQINSGQANSGQANSGQTADSPINSGASSAGQSASFAYENSCRHHQGDSLLASPASLIKLPIAIALMDKVEQENQSLDDKIYIDPNNFTENAEGASIDVDREYTLDQVMVRMINESNNIATNQLIDHVGRDAIAKTMTQRGYTDTLVDFKLAGDRILPPNPGTQSNQITSNDLTAMIVAIYGLENPGDEALLQALVSQQDREIGHTALKDLGPAISWLGEKTGQNDRLIGSTLAMKVGTQRYALTVAIDHSGDLHGLQAIIRGIAEHLLETGPLVSEDSNSSE